GYPWEPRYVDDLPALKGLRVHYLDEGPPRARLTALCLHGNPSWSYLYRHMIPVFNGAGLRVVAPDLIGFGRSDKPSQAEWHTFGKHRAMLMRFIERLDLRDILLVCQDWGGLLGLTLPHEMPGRFTRLLVMNTGLGTGQVTEGFRQWRAYSNTQDDLPVGKLLARGKPDLGSGEIAAYDAPFPNATFKAALKAFPNLVPDGDDAPGAAISRRAQDFWQYEWAGDSFMAIGMKDPVLGEVPMRALQQTIRNCPSPIEVSEAGHFVPEWGAPIARAALQHFGLS
ncbi:MAG TPA: haloalkane dehalogenase, partial [Burkholderiaceae bacterium]|nr:haloalkane dehalogenase [Burkholderiaceae bacterium]